jgi:hypothetical protein
MAMITISISADAHGSTPIEDHHGRRDTSTKWLRLSRVSRERRRLSHARADNRLVSDGGHRNSHNADGQVARLETVRDLVSDRRGRHASPLFSGRGRVPRRPSKRPPQGCSGRPLRRHDTASRAKARRRIRPEPLDPVGDGDQANGFEAVDLPGATFAMSRVAERPFSYRGRRFRRTQSPPPCRTSGICGLKSTRRKPPSLQYWGYWPDCQRNREIRPTQEHESGSVLGPRKSK